MAEAQSDARVILLRGINVGGHKKVPMAELRRIAEDLGLEEPRTYIASGNLICRSSLAPRELEELVETALKEAFGFDVAVIVLRSDAWLSLAARSPFPDAETERPNLLHLGLAKRPPSAGAAEHLARYASADERFEVFDHGVWIDFAQGAGRSKLTPKVLDAALGAPVTGRNWRTVQKLAQMIRDF